MSLDPSKRISHVLGVLDKSFFVPNIQYLPAILLGVTNISAAAQQNCIGADSTQGIVHSEYPDKLIAPRGSDSFRLLYHISLPSASTNQRFFQFLIKPQCYVGKFLGACHVPKSVLVSFVQPTRFLRRSRVQCLMQHVRSDKKQKHTENKRTRYLES